MDTSTSIEECMNMPLVEFNEFYMCYLDEVMERNAALEVKRRG